MLRRLAARTSPFGDAAGYGCRPLPPHAISPRRTLRTGRRSLWVDLGPLEGQRVLVGPSDRVAASCRLHSHACSVARSYASTSTNGARQAGASKGGAKYSTCRQIFPSRNVSSVAKCHTSPFGYVSLPVMVNSSPEPAR